MKTLYIVGNGFDVAHGLRTDYWKFRMYLELNHPHFLNEFEALYDIQPLDDTEPWCTKEAQEQWNRSVDNTLWSRFEKKMGYPDTTAMLDWSLCVVDDLDLESGQMAIRDTMDLYWQEQYGFINKLQDYIIEWIEQIDTSNIECKKKALVGSEDYFLNFNYTDTLERIYKIKNVLHIHGGVASVTDIPPVMGHCNKEDIKMHRQWSRKADEEYQEGEASIQGAIADYLEAIYKNTDFLISLHKDIFNSLKNVDHVNIIGWSGGEVDIPYLKKIRESVDKATTWTVYWYNDESFSSLTNALNVAEITGNYDIKYVQSNEFWD